MSLHVSCHTLRPNVGVTKSAHSCHYCTVHMRRPRPRSSSSLRVETGAGHVVVRVLARGVRGQAVSHTSSSGTRGNLIVLRSSRASARFDFTCTLELSFTRRPCREAAT